MLYNGHLVIADTFLRELPNPGQTLLEKPLIADIIIPDTFFEHRMNILDKTYLLIGNTLWLVGKKENTCMFLTDTFPYFNIKLIIKFFQAIFHPCYNSCISINNSLQVFWVPTQHHDWLLPVTSTRMWWFVIWRNLEATLPQFSGTCPTIFFETQSTHITATAV